MNQQILFHLVCTIRSDAIDFTLFYYLQAETLARAIVYDKLCIRVQHRQPVTDIALGKALPVL